MHLHMRLRRHTDLVSIMAQLSHSTLPIKQLRNLLGNRGNPMVNNHREKRGNPTVNNRGHIIPQPHTELRHSPHHMLSQAAITIITVFQGQTPTHTVTNMANLHKPSARIIHIPLTLLTQVSHSTITVTLSQCQTLIHNPHKVTLTVLIRVRNHGIPRFLQELHVLPAQATTSPRTEMSIKYLQGGYPSSPSLWSLPAAHCSSGCKLTGWESTSLGALLIVPSCASQIPPW